MPAADLVGSGSCLKRNRNPHRQNRNFACIEFVATAIENQKSEAIDILTIAHRAAINTTLILSEKVKMSKLRYWYDTKFIEHDSIIDLVSIGIICEDGREFYGINWECNFSKATKWDWDNILKYLPFRPIDMNSSDTKIPWHNRDSLRIAVTRFLGARSGFPEDGHLSGKWFVPDKEPHPELWTFYSAHNHVAFCQIFGTTINLPIGFPSNAKYLKHEWDRLGNPKLPEQGEHDRNHALTCAKYNKTAYDFLAKLNNSNL